MKTLPPMPRALPLFLGSALAVAVSGCATAPLLQKQGFDFKTTALFQKPCPVPEQHTSPPPSEASASPPTMVVSLSEPVTRAIQQPRGGHLETKDNRCNTPYIEKMVEAFLTIREADEKLGMPGDTLEDVRRKGFTIHVGGDPRVQRANTRTLHGADALAAVGMGVSAPPLQKPEDIRVYTEFMSQHYGEEYAEKDMKRVVDRFCLNRRESLDIGDERVFAIVWREGRVIKRVIKGGPIDNPKQERGFLLCPGDFVIDTVTGTVNGAVKAFTSVP